MNEHNHIADLLPLYVSGALEPDQQRAVEQHLPDCAECRADLALWRAMAGEINAAAQAIAAPRGLAERSVEQARQASRRSSFHFAGIEHLLRLLRSQVPLVQREIWPASALVIGLGYIAALISAHAGFIYALAPLVAAACVSLIYGPDHDPAYELALATPTSPRQILLARLALVFGYNLGLVLVAATGLLPFLATQPAQPLIESVLLAWLAPMSFLSAAALVLSLWMGATNAISITYIAWLVHLLAGPLRSLQSGLGMSAELAGILAAYVDFWQTPALLFLLSAALFGAAVWLAGRQEKGLLRLA